MAQGFEELAIGSAAETLNCTKAIWLKPRVLNFLQACTADDSIDS